jgi:hypothetical protein
MEKLTKREALEMSIKLWDYIAETGKAKLHAIVDLGLPGNMDGNCPACEYSSQIEGVTGCAKCPIWTGKEDCTDKKSTVSYVRWLLGHYSDRQKEAQAIADLARLRLKQLDARNERRRKKK